MMTSLSRRDGAPEQRRQQLSEFLDIARPLLGDELIRQPELDEAYFSSIRKSVAAEYQGGEIDLEEAFLRQVIITVGRRYGIRFPALKVKYAALENGAAALVFRKAGQWYMQFNTRYCRDDTRLTMLVAHEMAHIVLGQHKVILEPRRRNEEFTDAVAVLAGFGSIYRAGCLVTIKKPLGVFGLTSASHQEALGYLTPEDIDYLLGEKAGIRKQARSELALS